MLKAFIKHEIPSFQFQCIHSQNIFKMRNKGFIVFLTVIVTLLCFYYLSFTFVSRGVQKDATAYATDESGTTDFAKRQAYLDSVYREPVYNLLGIKYTYQEVTDNELSLGLDLKGGMHVTLEVSPVDIVKGIAGNPADPDFQAAIKEAQEKQRSSQEKFSSLFYEAYKKRKPDARLSAIFANAANRGKISYETTDQQILSILDQEIKDAVDRSFNILRTRIDRFGTTQPNIQQLPGTGRIQIELPGVDNPERVRNLLQGVAKLEFWEVWNLQEYSASLEAVNTMLVEEQKAKTGHETAPTTAASSDEDIAALLTTDQATTLSDAGDSTVVAEGGDSIQAAENELESQLAGGGSDSTNLDSLLNTEVSPLFSLLRSQYGLVYETRDTARINNILERQDVQNLLPPNLKFLWSVKPISAKESGGLELLTLYAIKQGRGGKAPLSGEVITDARQDLDQSSRPAVFMTMNGEGAKTWRRLTGNNIGRQIAIVLDGYVLSAPNVETEIGGGSSVISGNFSIDEAKDLANLLKAGALPAPTQIVEEAIIGPSLGQEAQNQGMTSIAVGLLMVVLFMIAYYSKGGMVANLALVFNILFILGILAQLNAALTLPGIAGMVLTMGMAVDANVLIFERIREELRRGSGLRAAITEGYSKAYSSIIDSNVTTFLTAVILYVVGQGPVKGFAITLMIGIICSFFSAVFISRVVIEWMVRKGDQSKLSFSFPFSESLFVNMNLDFLKKRKVAYIFSGSLLALGLIAVIAQPLTMGVDFTGGRSYVVTFDDPVVASDLKTALMDDFENAGTEVKTFGGNNILKITTSYMMEEEGTEVDKQVEDKLINGIQEFTGLAYVQDDSKVDSENFTISSSSKVGASVANDVKNSSYQALLFSLICIFLYVFIRFKRWQFGLGAVIALFHDTLMVFSAFAIAGALGFKYEIDQVFIAAILTVIGYSINDTVVIFDRIREELGLKPKGNFGETINLAINNTMSRTLITSGTTLIVVLVLFLFGGAVLKGFSFALLVGIALGTYSSIYIATPVVIDLTKGMETNTNTSTATAKQPA